MSFSCTNCGGMTENDPDSMVLCDSCIKDDNKFVERLQDALDLYRTAVLLALHTFDTVNDPTLCSTKMAEVLVRATKKGSSND